MLIVRRDAVIGVVIVVNIDCRYMIVTDLVSATSKLENATYL
jgi:hypothetical protein